MLGAIPHVAIRQAGVAAWSRYAVSLAAQKGKQTPKRRPVEEEEEEEAPGHRKERKNTPAQLALHHHSVPLLLHAHTIVVNATWDLGQINDLQ